MPCLSCRRCATSPLPMSRRRCPRSSGASTSPRRRCSASPAARSCRPSSACTRARGRSRTRCPPGCRAPASDGSDDLLGMKWVAGNLANNDVGLAGIYGLLVLNDPVTTVPLAILDAGPITAVRTAAVWAWRSGHSRLRSPLDAGSAPPSSAPASKAAAICPCSARCCPEWTSPCSTSPTSGPAPSPRKRAGPVIGSALVRVLGARGHRRRGRGDHRRLLRAPAPAAGHDERLAGPARARRARRLRHVLCGRGRPRRRPVPRGP